MASAAEELRSPYPYFGGKKRVASVMWRAFGPGVPNFIDPFFGSNSILLARPGGPGKIETINDADRMVANAWRSILHDPFTTAAWCDLPVNEADMHAIHRWLVERLRSDHEFAQKMHTDPDYFDAKIAGRWIAGIAMWIGGGWCVEPQNNKHPKLDGIGKGVHSNEGHGVRAYSPGRRPRLSDAGNGVHLPSLGNDKGVHGVSAPHGTFLDALHSLIVPEAPPAFEWFARLAMRMRRVRVACGDFERVLGDSVLGKGKNVGGRRPCAVVLDPPYSHDERCPYLYGEESADVAKRAADWAREHGDDPDLRIVLCGLDSEHTMPANWKTHQWKAARGYASADNENRNRETLWLSPHCLPIDQQPSLFGGTL